MGTGERDGAIVSRSLFSRFRYAPTLLSEVLAQAKAFQELNPEYLIVTVLFSRRKDRSA